MDANRSLANAVEGDPKATSAWYYWTNFINIAKHISLQEFGSCQVFDIHGNSANHKVQMGYSLPGSIFEKGPVQVHLNSTFLSLHYLVRQRYRNEFSKLVDLLLGQKSFAHLLDSLHFPSAPLLPFSETQPVDFGGPLYYNGGFNTYSHFSHYGIYNCNAIQIEIPSLLRMNSITRTQFSTALAKSILLFLKFHYDLTFF